MKNKNSSIQSMLNKSPAFSNFFYSPKDEDQNMKNSKDVDDLKLSDEYIVDEETQEDGEDF